MALQATAMAQVTTRKSIFITCQGTRGDVQPYVNLGVGLLEDGWSVMLGAPPEFAGFVQGHGLQFMDIGQAPTHVMYERSVSDDANGKAQRRLATRGLAAARQARELFNPADSDPFTKTWFRRILEGCRAMRPDVLVLVFTSWCGAAVIPDLLGLPTRVVLSYPMPMQPTSEFGVAMAGTGFSLCCSLFNRMQWSLSERLFVQRIHLAAARRSLQNVIAEEEAAGRPLPGAAAASLDGRLNAGLAPALFVFSPALLPKPADWPENHHVIGQLLPRRTSTAAPKPLPALLQSYLDTCRRENQHIVYIGFGSLGFFAPDKVTAILDAAAAAVVELARTMPVRAVIQTTLSSTPGKTGTLSAAEGDQERPYFLFSELVNHAALFPQVSLVVSHGGVGTVQAALGAGKPVLSMCCLPTADQSFWADLCYRRKLGPQWFWVDALTSQRMAQGIKEGLQSLELYTRNAEALAREMAKDDALSAAAHLLDAEAAAARKGQKGGQVNLTAAAAGLGAAD